jgi:3-oxoacyl-[acyl-carrier protein] reductase
MYRQSQSNQNACEVAIVTGASSGIGKEISISLLKSGRRVILVSRDKNKLETALSCCGESAENGWTYPADLTNSSQTANMIEEVMKMEGRIDILVNNLGKGLRQEIIETSDADWDFLFQVNLSSAFYTCRAVLPIMRKQKHGYIVNIGSRAGRCGEGQFGAYSAFKHGLVGLTKALADSESEYGIKVNVICPGPVSTESMLERHPSLDHSTWTSPQQVAGTVLYLVSEAANTINGQCIDMFK